MWFSTALSSGHQICMPQGDALFGLCEPVCYSRLTTTGSVVDVATPQCNWVSGPASCTSCQPQVGRTWCWYSWLHSQRSLNPDESLLVGRAGSPGTCYGAPGGSGTSTGPLELGVVSWDDQLQDQDSQGLCQPADGLGQFLTWLAVGSGLSRHGAGKQVGCARTWGLPEWFSSEWSQASGGWLRS